MSAGQTVAVRPRTGRLGSSGLLPIARRSPSSFRPYLWPPTGCHCLGGEALQERPAPDQGALRRLASTGAPQAADLWIHPLLGTPPSARCSKGPTLWRGSRTVPKQAMRTCCGPVTAVERQGSNLPLEQRLQTAHQPSGASASRSSSS